VQFALPPKGVNAVEALSEQQHQHYEAVCDVVIGQTNHWLEEEIERNFWSIMAQLYPVGKK
jgi:hypothetical protein